MTSWKDEPVLIVGGGIGGLTAALALARQGIPSQLIEQAAEFKEIGAGIQLGPNVFWMFEKLGLIEQIGALAVFPENLVMLDSITGEEVTRISLGDAFRKKFHHPYALIHRADLHNVLLEAARKSNLIRLDASQKIVAVDETNGGVKAKTASGKDYRGAALIGADGLWSTIRQIVVGDGKPKPAGHITYRAVLPRDEIPEPYRWWNMGISGSG
jgi:3-hydroxybenzoate 6-monooxygenase